MDLAVLKWIFGKLTLWLPNGPLILAYLKELSNVRFVDIYLALKKNVVLIPTL
jgi:hypothetical protein